MRVPRRACSCPDCAAPGGLGYTVLQASRLATDASHAACRTLLPAGRAWSLGRFDSQGGRLGQTAIESDRTHVLPLEFGRAMPIAVRGRRLDRDADGQTVPRDAMSGGSMAATLGHGRRDIIAAARAQAETSRSSTTSG